MRIVTVILFVCFIAGCKNEDGLPAGILTKDKMQAVFWDVVKAEAFTTQYIKKDSTKNLSVEDAKLQQKIFAVHKITKEDFYSSYSYYSTHADLMRTLLDSITSKSEKEKYAVLYAKPIKPVPVRFSLMPLPAPPLPKLIPMPIPTLQEPAVIVPPAQTILPNAQTILPSSIQNVKPGIVHKPIKRPIKQQQHKNLP